MRELPFRPTLAALMVGGTFLLSALSPVRTLGRQERPRKNGGASTDTASRHWIRGTWLPIDTTAPVGNVLREPGLVALLSDSQIVVFDYGDHTLRAFSLNGNLEWTLDGPGGVPATFVNVLSLAVDRSRRIWTAEENPGRVSIIDRLGRVDKVLGGMPGIRRALPLSHDSYLALFPDSPLPRLYDSTGALLRTVALPPPIETVSGLAGESWFATASNGRPVLAFIWSDRFVMLPADLRQARAHRGIERVDFPTVDELTVNIGGKAVESWRVDSSAVPAAASLSVDRNRIFVLFAGEKGTANRFRILDTYSADSGSYLGSYLLPEPAAQVAIRGNTVVMLAPLDHPSLRVWRWQASR